LESVFRIPSKLEEPETMDDHVDGQHDSHSDQTSYANDRKLRRAIDWLLSAVEDV